MDIESMKTKIGDVDEDSKRIIVGHHVSFGQMDMNNLSLTNKNFNVLIQEAKTLQKAQEQKNRSWEYTKDLSVPKFYLGAAFDEHRNYYNPGKIKLYIQTTMLTDTIADESSLVSMDYNPMLIDKADLDTLFNFPLKWNYKGINTQNVKRVVIGMPSAFLEILKRCHAILKNLSSDSTIIWDNKDKEDLDYYREEYEDPTLQPFPGYKNNDTIVQNQKVLRDLYEGLAKIILTKIDECPIPM